MNWKLNIVVLILSVVIFKIYFVRNVTDVIETMKETGYEGELHYTTTEDGYILVLQRIVRGPNTPDNAPIMNRHPVLLIHPLAASAIDWVYYHGNNSLPYLLFEKGYDVWLGNVRDAGVSFNHTSTSVYEHPEKFWNVSLHEIGFYDHPAMIDYILKKTGHKKVSYIGMSQGEATFLVFASSRPEYNEKVEVAILIAPSSHLKNSDNNFYKTLGKYWSSLEKISHTFGIYDLPFRDMVGFLCQYQIFSSVCNKILAPLVGYKNDDQYDSEITTKLFRVYGTKFSLKHLFHYLQIFNTGIFRRYDYGKKENLNIYGSIEPPEYDLGKISAPVALFWGENDCWSRPKDIEEMTRKLPNLVLSYKVPHMLFSHSDFLLAKDAKKLLYDELVKTVEKYNS
ncbi:hypothetical protein WA026_006316 [Henosepilachna vigintioctopunctata]|uniref:Lipase n=1 Tax=Henosepilachna vigintioctopunctata TaxID=420089 RepID=A0AAW1TPY4_9CUCU